jgi:hypothetical protein
MPKVSPTEQAGDFLQVLKDLTLASTTQRWQLKIVGTIGDLTDSKSISYINLTSQVVDAKTSGYKDNDIAVAIKKAISAKSNLRTYFDTTTMNLQNMLDILRDYHQERSSAELFAELGTLCQITQEKSTDFLMRALQLRQRTLTASKAEGSLFDQRLVQGTFLRAVKTGLREESIRAHLAPFLVQSSTSQVEDSTLLLNSSMRRKSRSSEEAAVEK